MADTEDKGRYAPVAGRTIPPAKAQEDLDTTRPTLNRWGRRWFLGRKNKAGTRMWSKGDETAARSNKADIETVKTVRQKAKTDKAEAKAKAKADKAQRRASEPAMPNKTQARRAAKEAATDKRRQQEQTERDFAPTRKAQDDRQKAAEKRQEERAKKAALRKLIEIHDKRPPVCFTLRDLSDRKSKGYKGASQELARAERICETHYKKEQAAWRAAGSPSGSWDEIRRAASN